MLNWLIWLLPGALSQKAPFLRRSRLPIHPKSQHASMPQQNAQGLTPPDDGWKDARKAGVCFLPAGPGSGLLVSWRGIRCILTNQHVLPDEATCRSAPALFGYTMLDNKSRATPCSMLVKPGSLFLSSPCNEDPASRDLDPEHLDYALAEVDIRGLPAHIDPLVLWSEYDARWPDWRNGEAWVVGHPDAGPRKTPQGGLKEGPNELSGEHQAFTKGGSSGSPVFLHAGDVPLLGVHYWGEEHLPGCFVRLPAIVTDLLKKEIIMRAGVGFDPNNADHAAAINFIASSLEALPTQV
jgi:hypothetical protein